MLLFSVLALTLVGEMIDAANAFSDVFQRDEICRSTWKVILHWIRPQMNLLILSETCR
ncbi:hypothetical protein E4T56_gene3091, partial [Termitomyces sp. T112]